MHNENLALISILVLGLLGWFRKGGLIFLQELVKIVVGITSKLLCIQSLCFTMASYSGLSFDLTTAPSLHTPPSLQPSQANTARLVTSTMANA